MAATIKDIARIVGVSPTAVSRALNGCPDIGEETRRKILEVARQLDYHPNAIARGLVKRRTNTIGLFVLGRGAHGFNDPFAYEVIAGVMDGASAEGYDLVLFAADSDAPSRGFGRSGYIAKAKERRVDGLIIMGIRTDDPAIPGLASSTLPVVLLDVDVKGPRVGVVTSDNAAGARQAVQYLISLGHRRIAMINGHPFATVSAERLSGYKMALERAGIAYDESLVFTGNFTGESGGAAVRHFWNELPPELRPTALFAASDLMAIGAMRELREMGISVPDQVSIVGFDDIAPASHVDPPLTTVRQDRRGMGAAASRMLVSMISQETGMSLVKLPTDLIVRGSTAPPARASA